MARHDVIANARVNRRWNLVRKSGCKNRTVFPAMNDRDVSIYDVVITHRTQKFHPSSSKRMRGFPSNGGFEFILRWEGCPIFCNEPPKCLAITLATNPAGEQREMNIAPGFIPRSEIPG